MTTSIATIVKSWVNNTTTEFPVDFELLWQGLGYSTKGNALRKFQSAGFIAGSDFIRNDKRNLQGLQYEYWLTIDAAKSFCMMANTQQGQIVRGYFIQCEKQLKQLLAEVKPVKAITTADFMEMGAKALIERANQERFCEDKPGLRNILDQASVPHKALSSAKDSLKDICHLVFDVDLTNGELSSLGRFVAGTYKSWHEQELVKEIKLVDGSYRNVAVYDSSMYPTIENWLRHEGHI